MHRIKHIIAKNAGALVMFFIAAGLTVYTHNGDTKTFLEVDYYAGRGMWQEVIESYRGNPLEGNPFILNSINMAMCNQGRLGYDMFKYPQRPDSLFLGNIEGASWFMHRIYFDIGHMNMAEIGCMIAMEEYGERPALLWNLALINMVKGKLSTARVFLEALDKTLFNDGWAEKYLDLLDSGSGLASDEYIRGLRETMVKDDSAISSSILDVIKELFSREGIDRKTFEYGMACCMLFLRFDEFIYNLTRLKDYGYIKLPGQYEEAILMREYTIGRTVDLQGYTISDESFGRFEGFIQTLDKYKKNLQMANSKLAEKYGDTYLYYIYKCLIYTNACGAGADE